MSSGGQLKIKPKALVRKLEFSNDGLKRILKVNASGSSVQITNRCPKEDVMSRGQT